MPTSHVSNKRHSLYNCVYYNEYYMIRIVKSETSKYEFRLFIRLVSSHSIIVIIITVCVCVFSVSMYSHKTFILLYCIYSGHCVMCVFACEYLQSNRTLFSENKHFQHSNSTIDTLMDQDSVISFQKTFRLILVCC